MFVNRLNSEHAAIPYEYDYFDFCTVANEHSESPVENLGQLVFGDRLVVSPYSLTFPKDQQCINVCQKSYDLKNADDVEKLRKLKSGISLNYQHHWIVDNLPITWCYQVQSSSADGSAAGAQESYCSTGFPMGCYLKLQGTPRYPCPIQEEVLYSH